MRKRAFAVASVLLVLALLAGCTATVKVGYVSNISHDPASGGFWQAEYSLFTGEEEHGFRLDGDGEHTFYVEITTTEGDLALSVTGPDDSGEEPFTGGSLPSGNFSFNVPGPGRYTLCVEAKNHKGGFDISWS